MKLNLNNQCYFFHSAKIGTFPRIRKYKLNFFRKIFSLCYSMAFRGRPYGRKNPFCKLYFGTRAY